MNNKSQRKNLRLKEYDYGGAGYYFVTICTKDRKRCLGDIVVGRDVLGAPYQA